MQRQKISSYSVPPLVVDTGNAAVKAVFGAQQIKFPHAIAEITDAEYNSIRFNKDYQRGEIITVDGVHYAVGESALSYRVMTRQRRAKYSRDYSGVLFASVVARAFDVIPNELPQEIRVFISHAPSDKEVNSVVKSAILGKWDIESGDNRLRFSVKDAKSFSEPVGSYFRQAFIRNRNKWETPLAGRVVGVLDIGGGTCSSLGVSRNAKEIEAYAGNGEQGINTAIDRLKKLLDANHPDVFSKAPPSWERMVEAVRNGGEYTAYGRPMDIVAEIEKAMNPLLNEVMALWHGKMGSGRDIDTLILTGGGSAILWNALVQSIDFGNIIAGDEFDYIEFANALGASIYSEVSEG